LGLNGAGVQKPYADFIPNGGGLTSGIPVFCVKAHLVSSAPTRPSAPATASDS